MKNIYEHYRNNGNRAGFVVRRNGWGRDCWARVVLIAGKTSGKLEGDPPYHGNAMVLVDFRDEGIVEAASCPGTFEWEIVSDQNA